MPIDVNRIMDGVKRCSKCGNEKTIECFAAHRTTRDRLRPECKACHNLAATQWQRANKEKVAARDKRYKERNRDKLNARRREYYAKAHSKVRATMNAWVEKNREKVRQKTRQWQHENKEKYLAIMRMVNAGRRFAEVTKANKPKIIEQLKVNQKGKCAACRCVLERFHIDHIMPIKRGGTNDPDNLQLLCVTCNCRKKDRHPVEFMQSQGYLL